MNIEIDKKINNYEKISDCLWDELYKEIQDIVEADIKEDDYSGFALKSLAEYTYQKIQNLITKNVDDEIIKDEIDNFWMKKIPLIIEAFDEDVKDYINTKYEHIQLIIDECNEKEKAKEEKILYEDEDLKVIIKDGIKKVIYKNKTEEIPEDHPLYILLKKFFEQV